MTLGSTEATASPTSSPSASSSPSTSTSSTSTSPEEAVLDWLGWTVLRAFGPRERAFLRRCFSDPGEPRRLGPEETARRLVAQLENDPEREHVELPADAAAQLTGARIRDDALAERARIRKHGLGVWTLADAAYPPLLKEVEDPPFVLTRRGSLETVPARTIAIVGSRRAKDFETEFAEDLARQLAARGIVVASGLARGIDKAAHEGALAVPGGRTVAVLGCGLASVYPSDHDALAERVAARGALVSELAVDAPPLKHHFPRRNRIVSGLAAATIVISAGEKSGALITARHALDQGREVLTIPGRLDDALARGTNRLLKEGHAGLLEGVDDVLRALGWLQEAPGEAKRPALVSFRARRARLPGILGEVEALLEAAPRRTFDELAWRGRFEASDLLAALGRLQGVGRVRSRDGYFELA